MGLIGLPGTFQSVRVTLLNIFMFHIAEYICMVQPKQLRNLWKSAKEKYPQPYYFPVCLQEAWGTLVLVLHGHCTAWQIWFSNTNVIQFSDGPKFTFSLDWPEYMEFMLSAGQITTWSDSKAHSWNSNCSTFWNRFEVLVWAHTVSALCSMWLRHFWWETMKSDLLPNKVTHTAPLLLLLLTISYQFRSWRAGKERLRDCSRLYCPSTHSYYGWPYTQAIEPENWAMQFLTTSTSEFNWKYV